MKMRNSCVSMSTAQVSDLVATERNRQVRMPDVVCKMQTVPKPLLLLPARVKQEAEGPIKGRLTFKLEPEASSS